MRNCRVVFLTVFLCILNFLQGEALAETVSRPVAVFSGLDKITARVRSFEVRVGEVAHFGALRVKLHACYVRMPVETPETMALLSVDAVGSDLEKKEIFSGWMFASSPGLNALEHPIFDIWLTGCKQNPSRLP